MVTESLFRVYITEYSNHGRPNGRQIMYSLRRNVLLRASLVLLGATGLFLSACGAGGRNGGDSGGDGGGGSRTWTCMNCTEQRYQESKPMYNDGQCTFLTVVYGGHAWQ